MNVFRKKANRRLTVAYVHLYWEISFSLSKLFVYYIKLTEKVDTFSHMIHFEQKQIIIYDTGWPEIYNPLFTNAFQVAFSYSDNI